MAETYAVAVAPGHASARWRNKTMTWAEFTAWQREPRRTEETHAEYASMCKADQGAIKNGECYVAGYLKGGVRKQGAVKGRSMVVLDADNSDADLWPAYEMLIGARACLYPTHSSTEGALKHRLVIALSREISPEEYVPLSLKLAETLGFAHFDPTTYQPERLMYAGSCSADAPYELLECPGDPLDPDEWLSLYPDWRDASCWPLQEQAQRKRTAKAPDPRTKRGVVGAFCRTYPISVAVAEFLGDVYEPGRDEGRYTFKGGSTFGGVVCYEDLWVYSNHATDPAASRLCNAFDLCRIHLFGDLDAGAPEGAAMSTLPSYKAATTWAMELEPVKALLDGEAVGAARTDFEEVEDAPKPWLSYSRTGAPQICYVELAREITGELTMYYNAAEFLRYDPEVGVWRGHSEPFVQQYIQQRKLGNLTTNARRSEAFQALRNEIYTPIPFDSDDPSKVVLANGVYDIPTNSFSAAFDPGIRARTRHDIEYNPEATCPAFAELVSTIYGAEALPFIYEWFGYCLYRAYPIKALLMLYGGRDTGKSTLINLLQAFVGSEGCSNITLKSLCNRNDRFSTINLLGKTMNADADAKAEYIGDGAELKLLVGGDTVTAEAKGQPHVRFKNCAKLVFGLNALPTASVAEAIASKMKILETNPTQLSRDDFDALYQRAEGERAGVFNEAMVGLRGILKTKHFTEPAKMVAAAESWRLENDTVELFVSERVIRSEGAGVPRSETYQAYKGWCIFCGRSPLGKHHFNRRMVSLGFAVVKNRVERWRNCELVEEEGVSEL